MKKYKFTLKDGLFQIISAYPHNMTPTATVGGVYFTDNDTFWIATDCVISAVEIKEEEPVAN